jgi:hypothetical protein
LSQPIGYTFLNIAMKLDKLIAVRSILREALGNWPLCGFLPDAGLPPCDGAAA